MREWLEFIPGVIFGVALCAFLLGPSDSAQEQRANQSLAPPDCCIDKGRLQATILDIVNSAPAESDHPRGIVGKFQHALEDSGMICKTFDAQVKFKGTDRTVTVPRLACRYPDSQGR